MSVNSGFELQGKITVQQVKINVLQSLYKNAIGKCSLPSKALARITGMMIRSFPCPQGWVQLPG